MVNCNGSFYEKIDIIKGCSSNAKIKAAAVDILSEIGFDKWLFCSESNQALFGNVTFASGQTWKWLLVYMGKCYQHIDPVIKHCAVSEEPLLWDSIQEMKSNESRIRLFWKDVHANGFGSGLSVPLRSPTGLCGLISVVSDRPLSDTREVFEQQQANIRFIGEAMHFAVDRLMHC